MEHQLTYRHLDQWDSQNDSCILAPDTVHMRKNTVNITLVLSTVDHTDYNTGSPQSRFMESICLIFFEIVAYGQMEDARGVIIS